MNLVPTQALSGFPLRSEHHRQLCVMGEETTGFWDQTSVLALGFQVHCDSVWDGDFMTSPRVVGIIPRCALKENRSENLGTWGQVL